MFAEIEKWLKVFVDVQHDDPKRGATAREKREQVVDLLAALLGMHPDTRAALEDTYTLTYPMPEPQHSGVTKTGGETALEKQIVAQTSATHFIRMDDRGRQGVPVPLDELRNRFLKTCLIFLRTGSSRPGPHGPRRRVVLAECMMDVYELHVGKRATATPRGTFDYFLGYILESAAKEPFETNRRTLIEAAIAQRGQKHPEREMRRILEEELTKSHGKERATEFLKKRIMPSERRYLEIQRSIKPCI